MHVGNTNEGAKTREIGGRIRLCYNGEDTKRNWVGMGIAQSL